MAWSQLGYDFEGPLERHSQMNKHFVAYKYHTYFKK